MILSSPFQIEMLLLQSHQLLFVAAVVLKSEISAQLVNSSVTEESRNVSYVTTAPLQNDVSKTDYMEMCSKHATQRITKLAKQLKIEPHCTESGAILDQLVRFIGYQFDKHTCGSYKSTTKYTEILYCSMVNTHTMCLQPFEEKLKNTNTETVPLISTVRNIVENLCAVKHLLERKCMFRQLKYVSRCVKTDVDTILAMEGKKWTYGALDTCRHLNVKIMCMWEGLQPCGKTTAGLMSLMISRHLQPENCTVSGAMTIQAFTWRSFLAIFTSLISVLFAKNTRFM